MTVTWHCLFSSSSHSSHSSHSCRLARYWKVGPGEDLLVRQHNATLDIFICYLFLLSKTHPALKKFKEHSIVFQKWFRFTLLLVSSKYVFINCHSFSGLSLRWTDYPRTATTACSPAPIAKMWWHHFAVWISLVFLLSRLWTGDGRLREFDSSFKRGKPLTFAPAQAGFEICKNMNSTIQLMQIVG